MITFTATIKKFGKQGEKTGWTYIEISAGQAEKLLPGVLTSFRVKGILDALTIHQMAIIPMGGGDFILPLNAAMRKALGKRAGSTLQVRMEADQSAFAMSADFIACLADAPEAQAFFNTLPGSHQRYFSKWIDSAKTETTKAKRITSAIKALSLRKGYAEMIREKL